MQVLRTSPEKDGFVTVALPNLETAGSQAIQRAAWSVAKANGLLALLPEPQEEVFDRVDWMADQADIAYNNSHQAQVEEDAALWEENLSPQLPTFMFSPWLTKLCGVSSARRDLTMHRCGRRMVSRLPSRPPTGTHTSCFPTRR